MAVLTHLETDTGTNVDISSATAVGAYTANGDKLIMVDVSIDAVAGNGDYVMYLTRQIGGSGSAYRILPQTTMAAASGLTAISGQSGWITVRNGDVLTCYVEGLAGDTSTPDWSTRWFESAVTLVTLADDAITASKFDESTAFPVKSADTGATAIARVGADSDTLETLSDQLDGAALEATLTAIKGAGWTDETLVAILEAIEDIDTSGGLDAAGVRAAIGLAIANLDTQLGNIHNKTTNLPATPAAKSDIPTVSDIATAVWSAVTRTLTALPTMAADWITALGIKSDAVTKIQSGIAKTTELPTDYATETNATANKNAIELAITNKPVTPATDLTGIAKTSDLTGLAEKTDLSGLALEATLAAMKGAGWSDETLVALMDAIKNSGGGGGGHSAQEVWEYPDRSLTENPTDLTSLVLLLTTIADNTGTAIPQLLAGLPAGVWSYITRTLTVSSVKPRTLPDGDQFSIYKDTSVLIPLTDLGDISAYTNLWFTMKREMDLQAGDEKAIIHADKVTGLLYIDQAVADDELGGITINDPTAGNISVWLHKSAAALLPVFSKEPLRWEVKGISPAGVDILLQGTNYILPAVTRKIT